jgi:hypothetical protein
LASRIWGEPVTRGTDDVGQIADGVHDLRVREALVADARDHLEVDGLLRGGQGHGGGGHEGESEEGARGHSFSEAAAAA